MASIPIFSQASLESVQSIAQIAEEVHLAAGQVVMAEGEPGDCLYLILEGEVEVLKDGVHLRTLSDWGTCFGEMSLIADQPRVATVQTSRPTQLLRICRDDFLRILRGDFAVLQGILRDLVGRLGRDLDEQMVRFREEAAQQESLRLAAEVQAALLPKEEIAHPRLMTAGYCRPAGQVGGDFYDYLYLDEDRLAVILGDVMGHGFHSAMLATMTRSSLRTLVQMDPSVHGVIAELARVSEQDYGTWIYLTCSYAILDLSAYKLEYVGAGSPSILLHRQASGEVVELISQYAPIGFETETEFSGTEITVTPGDVLVFSSDGLVTTEDPQGRIYGMDRLKSTLAKSAGLSPEEIRWALLEDAEAYRMGPPEDDITLVVARWL